MIQSTYNLLDNSHETTGFLILKTLLLASTTGIDIPPETKAEILRNKKSVRYTPWFLQKSHFCGILTGDYATYILQEYRDVFAEMIPEIKPMFHCEQQLKYHPYNVWEHTLAALINTPQDKIVRLVMFFHDIGKPDTLTFGDDGRPHFYGHEDASAKISKPILERLGFDKATTDLIVKMIGFHKLRPEPARESVEKLLDTIGWDNFDIFYYVRIGDNMGQSLTLIHERMRKIERIKKIAETLKAEEADMGFVKDENFGGFI